MDAISKIDDFHTYGRYGTIAFATMICIVCVVVGALTCWSQYTDLSKSKFSAKPMRRNLIGCCVVGFMYSMYLGSSAIITLNVTPQQYLITPQNESRLLDILATNQESEYALTCSMAGAGQVSCECRMIVMYDTEDIVFCDRYSVGQATMYSLFATTFYFFLHERAEVVLKGLLSPSPKVLLLKKIVLFATRTLPLGFLGLALLFVRGNPIPSGECVTRISPLATLVVTIVDSGLSVLLLGLFIYPLVGDQVFGRSSDSSRKTSRTSSRREQRKSKIVPESSFNGDAPLVETQDQTGSGSRHNSVTVPSSAQKTRNTKRQVAKKNLQLSGLAMISTFLCMIVITTINFVATSRDSERIERNGSALHLDEAAFWDEYDTEISIAELHMMQTFSLQIGCFDNLVNFALLLCMSKSWIPTRVQNLYASMHSRRSTVTVAPQLFASDGLLTSGQSVASQATVSGT